jgi:hypothetical protein
MKILVISMSTWGELGNWLSGGTLAATIKNDLPGCEVDQVKAESVFPTFGKIGAQIKEATLIDPAPERRYEDYSKVLLGYEKFFDALEQSGSAEELGHVTTCIDNFSPNLIIGTKGVICRVILMALKASGKQIPVINYVTNHGHFKFKIHHCVHAKLHMVRFEESRDFLISNTPFKPESIVRIGYLLATDSSKLTNALPSPIANPSLKEEYSVVIMSNRGGAEYLSILEYILKNHAELKTVFLAINDKELCEQARNRVAMYGSTNCTVLEELTQKEFLKMLFSFRQKGPTLYISKASPNAIFEAVCMNMALFLVRSGLPMEDWAAEMLVQKQLGSVDNSVSELITTLKKKIADPIAISQFLRNQNAFASRYLDQGTIRKKLVEAVQQTLSVTI